MADGCTDTKRHVRAAREWLGRAENSLEREDNIRGGLNLMLAEAELQRAREAGETPAWRRWLPRVLPAVAAAGLAAVFLWADPLAPVRPPAEAPSPATSSAPPVVPAVPLATEVVLPVKPPLPMEPVESEGPTAEEPVEAEPFAAAAIAAESTPEAPAEETISAAAPRLPSEDMQRLMSSAGQYLRAE